MIEERLEDVWDSLRNKKLGMSSFLREIRLQGLRGIDNLRITLDYPVSVIAGENASGKSTVLFSAACAYAAPGKNQQTTPTPFFPDYTPPHGGRRDARPEVEIAYEYTAKQGGMPMLWRRGKGQNRRWKSSFYGRPGGGQPERVVYLRTLSNLSDPSEASGVRQMSYIKTPPQEEQLTAAQIDFAHKTLQFEYKEVTNLSSGNSSILFASNKSGVSYSELNMAAGERTILRLAREVAQLKDALVLIDEVEASLHPWAQQLLMLRLQELALTNDLQVIVTTHSPVVLDSVPQHARIFLARDESGKVVVHNAYRDIIQNALYGRSREALNLLCEDRTAESILRGIMDFLTPDQQTLQDSVRIGRDTGASEFSTHAAAFRKFGLLESFVFVLDGDQRGKEYEEKIRAVSSDPQAVSVFYLPSDMPPEAWVWERLKSKPDFWARHLHTTAENLAGALANIDAIYASASDTANNIAKQKMRNLEEKLRQEAATICRTVARVEVSNPNSDIQPLVGELKGALARWRKK